VILTVHRDRDAYGERIIFTMDDRPPAWFRNVPGGDQAAWWWAQQHGLTGSFEGFLDLLPLPGDDPVPVVAQ
jgi:hypothetical protein